MYARLASFDVFIREGDTRYDFSPEDYARYKRFRVIKEMGWTYPEYQATPASIIDQVWAFLLTENKVQRDEIEHGRT